ncbi:MAG: hypothetical protein R2911_43580 [Caldilineaceae bacterium]
MTEAIQYYTERLGFRLRFTDVAESPQCAGIERDGVVTRQCFDPAGHV